MKAITTFLAFLTLAFTLTPSLSRADDKCLKGKQALDKGDYPAAIALLREGFHDDGKNVGCAINLATALLKMDSSDAAIAILVQAHDMDTANPKIYELQGDAYLQENIAAAAMDQFELATKHDTANELLWGKVYTAAMKQRNYGHAILALEWQIRLDTNNIEAYKNLGDLWFRASRRSDKTYDPAKLTKALPYLKYVFEKDPKDSLRNEYATALFYTGYFQELIPVCRAILADHPGDKEYERMLGTAYLKRQMNAPADSIFTLINDTTTMTPADWYDQAVTKKAVGKNDDAISSYEHAIKDTSLICKAAYDLGSLYIGAKRWDDAVAMFEHKIACDTSANFRFASHLNAAISLMQVKEFERARVHVIASIQYKPDYVASWRTLAECYAQMDSAGPENEAYLKVIDLGSADQDKNRTSLEEAQRQVGFHLLVGKKYVDAVSHFKEALAQQAKDEKLAAAYGAQTNLWLAQAYALQNSREESKKYYCKVLKLLAGKTNDSKYQDALKGLAALGGSAKDCGE